MCDHTLTRGLWPIVNQSRDINEFELLGSLFALQLFTADSHGISVSIFLDNTTAIACVYECIDTHSRTLSEIAQRIVR